MGRKPIVAGTTKWTSKQREGVRERVLGGSVMGKTRMGYEAKIRIFKSFVASAAPQEAVGKEHWFMFCEEYCAKSSKAGKSSLEAYRSALLFGHNMGLVDCPWITDEDVMKSCKAAVYDAGKMKEKPARGAISPKQAEDLAAWMRKEREPNMAEFVEVVYGAHAREEKQNAQMRDDGHRACMAEENMAGGGCDRADDFGTAEEDDEGRATAVSVC